MGARTIISWQRFRCCFIIIFSSFVHHRTFSGSGGQVTCYMIYQDSKMFISFQNKSRTYFWDMYEHLKIILETWFRHGLTILISAGLSRNLCSKRYSHNGPHLPHCMLTLQYHRNPEKNKQIMLRSLATDLQNVTTELLGGSSPPYTVKSFLLAQDKFSPIWH